MRDEVVADFQEVYGLDAERMGLDGERTTRDVVRAATLLAQLPATSRVARGAHEELSWATAEWLLWSIEHHLRTVIYVLGGYGEDAQPPDALPSPVDRQRRERADRELEEAVARVNAALGIAASDEQSKEA